MSNPDGHGSEGPDGPRRVLGYNGWPVVAVVVDPVYDFLDSNGAFAQAYGEEDTAPLREVKPELEEVLSALPHVVVGSKYQADQFRVPGLCTTPKGRSVVLERLRGTPLYKQGNSAVDEGTVRKLQEKVGHRAVLLCGVTTTACIKHTLHSLLTLAPHVIIPRNAVATRVSSQNYAENLLEEWQGMDHVTVVDSWRTCLEPVGTGVPTLHYVNGSIPSMRVLMALHATNTPFVAQRVYVMSTPRPTRTPEFLSINPRGKTPVLTVAPGVHLRESLALLQHVLPSDPAADPIARTTALALCQETELLRLKTDPLEMLFDSLPTPETAQGMQAILDELQRWESIPWERSLLVDCALYPCLKWYAHRGVPIVNYPKLSQYMRDLSTERWVALSTPAGWHDLLDGQQANLWMRGSGVKSPKVEQQPPALLPEGPIRCTACGAGFASNNKLHNHLREKGERHRPKFRKYTVQEYREEGLGPTKPLRGLGVGDSLLLFDSPHEAPSYREVRDEVEWLEMTHRGGPVPRLVAVQGDVSEGIEPVYRHPTDCHIPAVPFTPAIDRLRRRTEALTGVRINHALIQWYRGGSDYISDHADKTIDITRGTPVMNYSLGATRHMMLQGKKRERLDPDPLKHQVALPDHSIIVLGWESNRRLTHSIPKRDPRSREPTELLEEGNRISITFRSISTFRRIADDLLFGQGATAKELKDAVPRDDPRNSLGLLKAFSEENATSTFDWDEHYSCGFDCLHIGKADSLSPRQGADKE